MIGIRDPRPQGTLGDAHRAQPFDVGKKRAHRLDAEEFHRNVAAICCGDEISHSERFHRARALRRRDLEPGKETGDNGDRHRACVVKDLGTMFWVTWTSIVPVPITGKATITVLSGCPAVRSFASSFEIEYSNCPVLVGFNQFNLPRWDGAELVTLRRDCSPLNRIEITLNCAGVTFAKI